MLFKDLKPGYPVYLLQKGETKMEASQGKVINVSQPYFPQSPAGSMQPMNMQTMQRVVDVTIEHQGKNDTYSIPETLSVTYAQNLVLSTDRDGILRDVEAIKNQSAEVIASVEKHRAIVSSCDHILEEWNPALAEKKEQEKKITKLEAQLENMHTEMGKMGRILEDIAAKIK